MRSYWSGTISVGLLAIPVKLYGGAKGHDSKFKKVHRSCMTPIKQAMRCDHCDSTVTHQETTRGHLATSGLFVEVTDADLDALPLPSSGAIVLDGFTAESILPKMRREKSVYIGPDKGGQKAYAVLLEAMHKRGVVAVGKVAIRDREHLVAVEAEGAALVLTQVYYGDEVSPAEEVPNLPGPDSASPREVEMAGQVIDALPLEQSLDSYADGAQVALDKVLQAKVTGQPLPMPVMRPAMPVDDLLTMLKKTLDARK